MNKTKGQFFLPCTQSRKQCCISSACATALLPLMLLLALPTAAQTQFSYVISNGSITITRYTGPGGAVTIPRTITRLPVTSIWHSAFANCTSLTSVTIPDTVTSIGQSAFAGCTSLLAAAIPDSVTKISDWAFCFCTSMTNVTIGNGVTTIGDEVFAHCAELVRVTVGSSVSSIGYMSFGSCRKLTAVCFRGNVPGIASVFTSDTNPAIYYLPGATGWGSVFDGRPAALWLPRVRSGDTSFGVRTNQFGFNVDWADGRVVVVQASANLASPIWIPLQTNTLSGDSFYFSDPRWMNHPTRFYRVLWRP